VEHADNLKIVYFDQARESLQQQKTIKQFLADGNDTVIFKDRANCKTTNLIGS